MTEPEVLHYDCYENGQITLIRYGEKLTFSERLIRNLFGQPQPLGTLWVYNSPVQGLLYLCWTFINSVSYSTQCYHSVYDLGLCKACV